MQLPTACNCLHFTVRGAHFKRNRDELPNVTAKMRSDNREKAAGQETSTMIIRVTEVVVTRMVKTLFLSMETLLAWPSSKNWIHKCVLLSDGILGEMNRTCQS